MFLQATKKKHQDLACLLFAQAFPFPQASLQHQTSTEQWISSRPETWRLVLPKEMAAQDTESCVEKLWINFPSPSPSNAEKGKTKVKEKKKYLKSNFKKSSFVILKLLLRVCKTEATSAKHLLTSEQPLSSSSHPYHHPNSTEKQTGATWAPFSPPHVPPEETCTR